jgi:hypothetical protein
MQLLLILHYIEIFLIDQLDLELAEESMERMRNDGLKRLIISYKDSAIGRGVLSYENGRFTRLIVIANNPRIAKTDSLDYEHGLTILSMIAEGAFILVSDKNAKRNVETVGKLTEEKAIDLSTQIMRLEAIYKPPVKLYNNYNCYNIMLS